MRSETNQINSVRLDFLQRKNRIACRHCHDAVKGGTSRTVLDDSGTLAITAWTCARCGGVVEEIRIMVQDGKAQPRPIRYAVAPPRSTGRPAPVAQRALRN
jgi:RNase P subunit RPR2